MLFRSHKQLFTRFTKLASCNCCITVTRYGLRSRPFNTRRHVVLLTWACCINLRVAFFGLGIILRRMSSVTSGMRTEGGLLLGALATEPVALHFLTNTYMALFAGRPLPGNLLPKISRVSLIEPVFMYASTIATFSATKYVILHNKAQCYALNATFNWTDESRPTTCDRVRPVAGGGWRSGVSTTVD